ncbi:MAG: hypothetical protein AAB528_00485 [Chloroflexota bacterium]
MSQEQQPPFNVRRPWYYQNWFLIPSFFLGWPFAYPFVLWPVWALLIIRSPWHTSLPIRALAWAMLVTGAILVIQRFREGEGAEAGKIAGGPEVAVLLILPGFILTVVTQVLWARYRMKLRAGGLSPTSPPGPSQAPVSSTRRTGTRRRVHRRRGSRPGRSSRRHQ